MEATYGDCGPYSPDDERYPYYIFSRASGDQVGSTGFIYQIADNTPISTTDNQNFSSR